MSPAPQPAVAGAQTISDQTLRGLTKMFIAGLEDYGEDKIADLDVQLCRLIQIVGSEARTELSRSLAPVANAPVRAVRRLAFDEDIAVAGPTISQSVSLTSDEVARIARTRGPDHLAAICERPRLDVAVTEALLERGDATIAHKVAAHPGAEISLSGFSLLISRAQQDTDLAVRAGSRPDIPTPALTALLSYVDKQTRARIHASAGPEAGETVRRVLEQLARNRDAAPHDFSAARAEVGALHRAGALATADVQRFAEAKRYEHTAVALSLLSGAPVELIDRLFRLASDRLVLVPCRAADLAWPAVAAVMRLCAMGRPTSPDEINRQRVAYLDITHTAAQSVLRHWVVHGPSAAAGATARRPRVAVSRRRATRRQVQTVGSIAFPDGRPIADCTIIDISADGAKLELARDGDVPHEFMLRLSTSGGLRRACKVMWRAGKAIGVRFRPLGP